MTRVIMRISGMVATNSRPQRISEISGAKRYTPMVTSTTTAVNGTDILRNRRVLSFTDCPLKRWLKWGNNAWAAGEIIDWKPFITFSAAEYIPTQSSETNCLSIITHPRNTMRFAVGMMGIFSEIQKYSILGLLLTMFLISAKQRLSGNQREVTILLAKLSVLLRLML